MPCAWSDGGHDAASTHETEELEASYTWLDHYVRDKASASRSESALPTAAFTYGIPASRTRSADDAPHPHGIPRPVRRGAPDPRAAARDVVRRRCCTRPADSRPRSSPCPVSRRSGSASRPTRSRRCRVSRRLSTPSRSPRPPRSSGRHDAPHGHLGRARRHALRLGVARHRGLGDADNPLVAPVRLTVTPGRPTPVTISLPAATYDLPAGTRWRVLLTSTESTYSNSRTPSAIRISGASALTLPVAAGAAVGGGVGRRRRHRDAHRGVSRSPLAAPRRARRVVRPPSSPHAPAGASRPRRHPARRRGAVKTYADGHRAVDDVTWRAEKGQVVGLLGPNGAGKTTTMRMVMGLISSDAGSVHVLGEPVSAGSPVLGRVGALIEGRASCRTSRAARTSRPTGPPRAAPPEDAHFDEALDVAALGGAVDRPVKSYSQGMRQRLGIAQAMLGPARAAHPRRADQRPRPAPDRGHAPDPAPLRRDAGAPSSCRATCSPRSR